MAAIDPRVALALVVLFGLVIGSFLNVVIVRLPAGRSLWQPGSRCPGCDAPIAWYDNIPLVSFALLRARCRACGIAIPWRYPLVEAGTAVLLVEDDRAVRGHVRKALAALGLSVLEARDGLEATRIADRRARIDLLVTDLVLPGLGGAEVARRLTVARRDLRVLYLSGYTETVLGLRGWLPRGAPFLEKPFSLDTLIRKVTALLAAPSGR